jgi:hypothetical protein
VEIAFLTDVDAVGRLEAVEAVKTLEARYFRGMDTKDWDGFADQFSPDAVMDVSGEMGGAGTPDAGVIRGNREIAGFVREMVGDVVTVHHGHMPEITVTSPTTADGIWAMEDMLQWPDGFPIRSMHGYGHYHETYEKLDGRWVIKMLVLTRLRTDVE